MNIQKIDQIRLGCIYCDRSDFDGAVVLPADWDDIKQVQSYEDAIRGVDVDDVSSSVLDWQTHLGVCPDCPGDES